MPAADVFILSEGNRDPLVQEEDEGAIHELLLATVFLYTTTSYYLLFSSWFLAQEKSMGVSQKKRRGRPRKRPIFVTLPLSEASLVAPPLMWLDEIVTNMQAQLEKMSELRKELREANEDLLRDAELLRAGLDQHKASPYVSNGSIPIGALDLMSLDLPASPPLNPLVGVPADAPTTTPAIPAAQRAVNEEMAPAVVEMPPTVADSDGESKRRIAELEEAVERANALLSMAAAETERLEQQLHESWEERGLLARRYLELADNLDHHQPDHPPTQPPELM
eukprot:CAMPEP_0196658082 /NCGR_PEP_ID=MMETSP1086-20130531/27158_1 /TAXON_ID=77921 /ORGANISM="Cyanoptyche  gloeocystis , Strain SAG4.97" /LENGTH=278 /DNA_ID=CAMNT_0041991485 /DNA_START=281 /DNA_END=1118 /DNA_ORIENTATION=+